MFFLFVRRRFLADRFFRDFAGESFQLFAAQDGAIHHAENEFLGRPAAEAVNDALYGADGNALPRVGSPVNKRPALRLVREIALFFQPAQDRADG